MAEGKSSREFLVTWPSSSCKQENLCSLPEKQKNALDIIKHKGKLTLPQWTLQLINHFDESKQPSTEKNKKKRKTPPNGLTAYTWYINQMGFFT